MALRILVAVILTETLVLAAACRDGDEELPPPAKNLPTQVIDDFTLTETDGKDVAWRLKADRADVYDYANEAKVFVVHVDFYEEGEYSSTLTAREGTVDLLHHSMTARGDVVLVSRKDGAVLKTEELSWDADGHRIYSEAYCTLERGKSIIRGQGFTATPGLESFSTHELNADLREKEMEGLERRRPGGEEEKEGSPPPGGTEKP
ncbi:MAG: LPS export ABC transporter periplasmic protein LptC [Candidatus Coatesbacteria bacterium]|nr:MAG: LPS export ABC transporter periplasmic protein LptC [Candidatus Coatesbacteria bacterium]